MQKNFEVYLKNILDKLPTNSRANIQNFISEIKSDKVLLPLFQTLYNDFEYVKNKSILAKIAIIGPPNTGKSSLFNRILGYDFSEVSSIAGTTKENILKRFGPFVLTDTPGLGQAFEDYSDLVVKELQDADVIFIVFDITKGFLNSDIEVLNNVFKYVSREKVLIIFNKIDLLDNDTLQKTININNSALSKLSISAENIVYISVKNNTNIDSIIYFLLNFNKYIAYDLAKLSKIYKEKVALDIVNKSSLAAAGVGFFPIPLADIIPLTAIQINMILQIAKIYNKNITIERAKEILPVLAGGFLFRTGFRQLIKLVPGIGDVGAGIYSAAATYALGRVAIVYFSSDKKLTKEQIKALFTKFFKERIKKENEKHKK